MKMKHKKLLTSVFALVVILVSQPANGQTLEVGSTTMTNTNQDCVRQINQERLLTGSTLTVDVCTTTTTLTIGPEQQVTVADVLPLASKLSQSGYSTLLAAAVAGTVKSKTYLQSMNNVTDGETQTGTFYYDGDRAWVTSSWRGYTGSHICKVDWAVGYTVTKIGCTDTGSPRTRTLSAHWGFRPLNSFIYWEEVYTLYVNSAGSIWQ
jgi:hypothetical protein